MDEEPQTLVTILADDAPIAAAGSSTDRKCSKCAKAVLLAPSGQRFMKANPDTIILCIRCFRPEEYGTGSPAASAEELKAEFRTAQPNTYRGRN